MLSQARCIAKTGEKVPLYAARALSRAIRDRGRANAWYETFGNKTQDELKRHQYFVAVLEECFEMLHERFDEQVLPAKAMHTKDDGEVFMRNLFGALYMETTTGEDDKEEGPPPPYPGDAMVAAAKKAKEPKVQQENVFSGGADPSLAVYSFFETAHKEVHRLREAWRHGCSGNNNSMLALVGPTLLTSAALDQLQQMEDDLVSHICGTTIRPYSDLVAVLYGRDNATNVKEPHERFSSDYDFSLIPIGESLQRLTMLGSMHPTFGWPEPLLPMELYYAALPGFLYHQCPRFVRSVEEDKFLCHVVLDMELLTMVDQDATRKPPSSGHICTLPQDCFTKALSPVWRHLKVTATSVFAAKLLLDLREILPSNGRTAISTWSPQEHQEGTETLQEDSSTDGKTSRPLTVDLRELTFVKTKKQVLSESSSYPWVPNSQRRQQRVKERAIYQNGAVPAVMVEKIASFIWDDSEGALSTDIEAVKALNLQIMQAHRDELFLVNVNPAIAGHFALQLHSTREIVAIAHANETRSIALGAYLYQLALVMGAVGQPWAEMDRVIQVHGREIFGEGVPTTVRDLVSRFLLRAGLSTDKKHRARRGKFMQLQPTVLAVMAENLSRGVINLPTLLGNISTTTAQETNPVTKVPKGRKQGGRAGKVQGQEQKSNARVVLATALEKAQAGLKIDYTSIIRRAEEIISALSESNSSRASRLSTMKPENNSTELVSTFLQKALSKKDDEVPDLLRKIFSGH